MASGSRGQNFSLSKSHCSSLLLKLIGDWSSEFRRDRYTDGFGIRDGIEWIDGLDETNSVLPADKIR